MIMFSVGRECPVNTKAGASITYSNGMFTVFIKMSDLFEEDIKAFNDNELKLAICKYDPKTLFFVYGIEGFVYMSDIAFNINYTAEGVAGLTNNFENGTGYGFTFVLIEEESNVIKAMRSVGITKSFSDTINECCKEQAEAGLDGYEETVMSVYKKFSTEQIVQRYIKGGCRFRAR